MSGTSISAIGVLCAAEVAWRGGCRNVCNVLQVPPTSTVREILVGGGEALAQQQFVNLLEGVSITVAQHGIRRTIRDWPFENFWTDPNEPLHSKFLGYFINPRQGHNCSDFLLKHFLKVLKGAIKPASLSCRTPPSFRADGCEVNDPEAERIDLCIERTCDDEKFAIIIENKIHFAIDQPNQLQGYVQKVHQRGFDYSQIWVFYAPLTAEKDPHPDDRSAVERLGVCYNKITFQTEIVAWLNNALAPGQLDLPSDMDGGMADNLGHYRDLIRHLIEKHKEFQMKSQILQQLHQAQDAGTMPKFSDLDSMRESMASLQKCLEQVYRAKLMREIHRLLTVQRKKVLFCLEAEPAEEISINSDFDERFDANVDVCVSVDQGVRVCFGGSGGTWIGYMKQGRPEDQKRVEARVLSEAKEQLKEVRTNDPKWFGWDYKAIGYTDTCLLTLPQEIANKLLEMSNRLTVRLKGVQ